MCKVYAPKAMGLHRCIIWGKDHEDEHQCVHGLIWPKRSYKRGAERRVS